ncbi:MAG: hypothetical protein ACYTF1_11000 [Planctomycetota bacterium]|jgi:hypothetical protein
MPQKRITLSHRIFYIGLLIMLAASILSTTIPAQNNLLIPLLILTGALISLAARIWRIRIHRAARQQDTMVDIGGYPLELINDPHFTTRRRPAA